MIHKVNDPVVVLVRGTPASNHSYRKGVVVSVRDAVLGVPTPNPEKIYRVKFDYAEQEFHESDVQKLYLLSDEAAAAQHAEELPKVFESVRVALAALLPDEKVEIKEGSVVGYHGAVTIDPVVFDGKRIGGIQERAGWQVTTWHVYPATRVQPEDVSDSVVGTYSWHHAAREFIKTVFALKAEDYWQAGADAAMAEEFV